MPGISIKNESGVPLMVCLSQLSPLHWTDDPIEPNTTKKLSSGRVWFTLSVGGYSKSMKPTKMATAARLGLITGSTLIFGLPALVVTGIASGVTSTVSATRKNNKCPGLCYKVKGVQKLGVYADNRTYVIKGFARPDGAYELYVDSVFWVNKQGDVTRIKEYMPNLSGRYAPLEASQVNATSNPVVATTGVVVATTSEEGESMQSKGAVVATQAKTV